MLTSLFKLKQLTALWLITNFSFLVHEEQGRIQDLSEGRRDKLLKDKLLKDKLRKDKLLKRQTPERQTPDEINS